MPSHDNLIRAFRGRVALAVALSRGVRFLALACFAWGTGVLVARVGFFAERESLLWGLAGLAPVAVAAALSGLAARPSRQAVRALLDRHNHSGGLWMAAGELEIGPWRERLSAAVVPKLRARPSWGLLAGGSLFAVAAFWTPVASSEAHASRRLEIDEEVEEVAQDIAVLKEESLLDEEQADRLEAELAGLLENADGADPASSWAALDHLQEMTERTAEETAEAALSQSGQLAAAEAVAEALAGAEDTDAERLAEAMRELSALTARSAAESRLLDPALAQRLAAGASNRDDLGRLLEALSRAQGSLSDRLERLYAEGMIDLETLLAARATGRDGLDSLAEFLAENGLDTARGYCLEGGLGGGGSPGRGGISRGRGDAPMTWGQPSSAADARFEEQILDSASLAALGESELLGLTAASPDPAGITSPAPSDSVLGTAGAGAGAAHTQTLLPRHRGAVRRYFDRSRGSR